MLACGFAADGTARAAPQDGAPEFFAACTRHLQRTVVARRDGSHLARLFALRQLHDPSLRPLLHKVAQSGAWQIRVHGILGLAEIEDPSRIDPWLLSQIEPGPRQRLLANAIDMKLLGPEQMRQLVTSADLDPMSRLLLIGELLLGGDEIDREIVNRLAGSPQQRIAGLASMILAQLGDPSTFSAYRDRIAVMPRRDRQGHLRWLLDAVRQYELTALLPWALGLVEDEDADQSDHVRYWAVYTVLALDPEGGLATWSGALGDEPAYRERIRFGMLLLAAGPRVPAGAYERVAGEEDLSRAIALVGRAISTGADVAPAMIALFDLGHLRTAQWAMGALRDLPDEQAGRVYAHLIESVDRSGTGRSERIARAVVATSRLVDIDADAVLTRLARVEDDSLAQEVLLLGLFDARSGAVEAAVRDVRRIGAGRADSLALLLLARHSATLSGEDLAALGRIAAGGGRVSTGLQTQAAWLYLKHTGSIDRALSHIFDRNS